MSPDYIERLRVYVDEGGQLSHRNGLDLLTALEKLRDQPKGALAETIRTRLLGIRPEDQDVVLDDDDWRLILSTLTPQDGN